MAFLNEWCAHASGLVSALERFQRVSVSSWEPASNIVFVSNETTLKLMPLPGLWGRWGRVWHQPVLGVTPHLRGRILKKIKIIYDNVSGYTRSCLNLDLIWMMQNWKLPISHVCNTGSTAVLIETWIEVSCLQSWLVIPPQAVLFPLTEADLNS